MYVYLHHSLALWFYKKSSVLFHFILFQTSQWIIVHNKDELKLWSDNKTRCHHANNSNNIKIWVKKNGNECKYTKSWSLQNEASALAMVLLHKDVYLWIIHTLFLQKHTWNDRHWKISVVTFKWNFIISTFIYINTHIFIEFAYPFQRKEVTLHN